MASKLNFEEIKSKYIDETVFYTKHPAGPDIYLVPKPEFNSQYAIFGTKYGSIDNRFAVNGDVRDVPAGIAHYLEHKMFESEDGDAFARYARTGASANAFTSFDKTCYLFASTDHFYESLGILLDFVQHPYFTEQNVQKEQGIIGQEIRMYDDNPKWQVFFGLLSAVYHTCPVKIDIAGTVESIAKITPELLYECYYNYYNLNNMVLCVAGNFDAEKVMETADSLLKPAPPLNVRSVFDYEPDSVVRHYAEKKLAVSKPLFNIGFKDTDNNHPQLAKKEAATYVLLDYLFGTASGLYKRLYDSGLINDNFGHGYEAGRGFSLSVISGESDNPQKVMDEIIQEIELLKKSGIDKRKFEFSKRAVYGSMAMKYDDIEEIAVSVLNGRFLGMKPFGLIEAAAEITIDEVEERLNRLSHENCALSVIKPLD